MRLIVKHFSELSRDELFEIYRLRVSVFVVEQNCPYQEIDETDRHSYHLWLEDDGKIMAYLRVIPTGVIRKEVSLGRVMALKRRCGLGSKIVSEAIRFARQELKAQEIVIEAQVYVQAMYEQLGFKTESEVFLEDGIPHVQMRIKLQIREKYTDKLLTT